MKWTANEIAIVGMATTIAVAIISGLTAYLASKRERRRTLYSEAVQAIVSWKEMLYRVRRRADAQGRDLISSFHDLQDKLSYYQAWIGGESKYMNRSYARLVRGVKSETDQLIRDAWEQPIRPEPGNAIPGDVHPRLETLVEEFSRDVRSHLSPLPWRKLAVVYRNRADRVT